MSASWRLRRPERSADGQPANKAPRAGETGKRKAPGQPEAGLEAAAAAAGAGGRGDLRDMVVTLQRLSLQTAQITRGLAGAQYKTMLVPASAPPAAAAKEAGALYFEAVAGVKNHGKGPPHLHTGMAFLETLAVQKEFSQEDQTLLKAIVAVLGEADQNRLNNLISFFKVRDARARPPDTTTSGSSSSAAAGAGAAGAAAPAAGRAVVSYQFNLTHDIRLGDLPPGDVTMKLLQSLQAYAVAVGGEVALGAAPPGQAERKVQKELQRNLRQ